MEESGKGKVRMKVDAKNATIVFDAWVANEVKDPNITTADNLELTLKQAIAKKALPANTTLNDLAMCIVETRKRRSR